MLTRALTHEEVTSTVGGRGRVEVEAGLRAPLAVEVGALELRLDELELLLELEGALAERGERLLAAGADLDHLLAHRLQFLEWKGEWLDK